MYAYLNMCCCDQYIEVGIYLFIKSSEKLVESKYLKSLAYLIIGELCYQGTINFFITFTFLLLIIKK